MVKILMVTSRDVVDDNGNARGVGAATLIYRRASELYKTFNAKTYVIPMNGNVKQKYTGYAGCEFVQYKDLSIKESISNFINKNKPEIIVLSGEKAYIFIKYIKKVLHLNRIESEIILDLHGALEEGIEYVRGLLWFKNYLRYRIKKMMFKYTLKYVDGFFVVSDELKDHYKKMIPLKYNDKHFYKIRCGINEIVDNNLRLKWRKEIRQLLKIQDDTIVFVYSGYRAKWQCIDEIIQNFKIINSINKNVFFMLLTESDDCFEKFLKDNFPQKNYFLGLVSHDQIYKYLSACDVAMLIRHDNYTNRVAFPNKFSDYINAGLIVALSPSLREPTRLLESYKIPHIKLKPEEKIKEKDLLIIAKRHINLKEYYDLCNKLCNEELLYSTQIISQWNKLYRVLKSKGLD